MRRSRARRAFWSAARLLERLFGLEGLHQACDLTERDRRQLIQFSPFALGDVFLVDRVAKMVLRLHQRCQRNDGEPGELGRVESPEAFCNVCGGTGD